MKIGGRAGAIVTRTHCIARRRSSRAPDDATAGRRCVYVQMVCEGHHEVMAWTKIDEVGGLRARVQRQVMRKRGLRSALSLARQVVLAYVRLRRCTSVGRLPRLEGKPYIHNGGTIILGERIRIASNIAPVQLAAVHGGRLEIGDSVFLNNGVSISAHELVRLGSGCLLGVDVMILDNNWHDVYDRAKTPPSRPVILEDNVWLGNRSIVLPGVTIGHDSIVGAGAVVTRDVPPRTIVAGNPAEVVKTF